MWVDLVVDLVTEIISSLDRSHTLTSAYKRAWKRRLKTGDASVDLLVKTMKERSVSGAYDELDSPRIAPAVQAWQANLPPRDAKQMLKRAPKKLSD